MASLLGGALGGLTGGSIGSAVVNLTLADSTYNAQLAKAKADTEAATGTMSKAASGFKALSTAAFIGAGIAAVHFAADAVKAASDEQESLNKTRVVFGLAADEVVEFAETSAESFGISSQAALEASASFGNMLLSAGLAQDEVAGMSVELVKLAADLASFNNVDPSVALERLRSGLSGQARPLRAFGILMSETAVQTEAYATGIAKVGDTLTEGQKVQARYSLILKQTGTAQGDFARTSDGLANQQRILAATFEDVKAKLGAELLPAIQELLPALVTITGFIGTVMAPVLESLGESAGILATALEKLGVTSGKTVDDQSNLAKAWDFATSSSVDLGKKIYWLNPLLEDDAVAAHNAADASTELKEAALHVADAVERFGNVEVDAAAKTRDHTKAMREQRLETLQTAGGILGLVANMETVAEDERELQQLREDGKRGTAEYNEKVRESVTDQLSLRTALREQAAQMKENGARTNEIKATLKEMATQAGISGRDFRAALHGPLSDIFADINNINRTPLNVHIAPGVVSGIKTVEGSIKDALAALGGP